jgi:radical SAM superfamily enzyme YgiQ (UPF0313 family)
VTPNAPVERVVLIAPKIVAPRGFPSVGVTQIATYLHERGVQVRVVDTQFTRESPEEALSEPGRALVGVSVDSRTIFRGLELASRARELGHEVVLGGVHPSLLGAAFLDAFPDELWAIRGDGEIPMLAMYHALRGEASLTDVPGLIFRDEAGVARANPPEVVGELDSLPPPDFHLAGIDSIPFYPLSTSRGCPHHCIYCTVGTLSRHSFRANSAERVVAELALAKRRYGTRRYVVVDENFAHDRERVLEICALHRRERLDMLWTAFEGIRADDIEPKMLEALRESGCRWLFFGIETSDDEVLHQVAKQSEVSTTIKALGLGRKFGFKLGGFFVVGMPGSSFDKEMASVELATGGALDEANFWMATPYYGTPLHRWVLKRATLLRQPLGDGLINSLSTMPFFEFDGFPAEEIKRAHTIANLRSGVRLFLEDYEGQRLSRREREARIDALTLDVDPSLLSEGAGVPTNSQERKS